MIEYSAGIVTAYGSAVRAGYTGTYEDFCRQQAQYADNASAVEQAKQTAVSASQSANQAKQDAQTASTTAQQSAQSAQGSAQSAGQSAQDAQTAKNNAQGYAQSASASAGSAQQSAQTAQAVLESIPEDYSDLSSDVVQLKADLDDNVNDVNALENRMTPIDGIITQFPSHRLSFKKGYFVDNGAVTSAYYRNRACLSQPIELKAGDILHKSLSTTFYYLVRSEDGGITYEGVNIRNSQFDIRKDCIVYVTFIVPDEISEDIYNDEFYNAFWISRPDNLMNVKPTVKDLTDVELVLYDGYYSSGGAVVADPSENACKYTQKIKCFGGMKLHINLTYLTSSRLMWIATCEWKNDGTFVRTNVISGTSRVYDFDYIPSNDVNEVSITFRSFNDCEFTVQSLTGIFTIYETLSDSAKKNQSPVNYAFSKHLIKGINHRGYNRIAPENTMPAFKLSVEHGFSFVETDIRFTSDNIPVLLHDATVDRTSNGTGNIADMTFAQARELDFGSWKSETYTGTKIPSFEEFILFCRNVQIYPYIEISGTYTPAQFDILVEIVKNHGMLNAVTWISFNTNNLKNIALRDATARLCQICSNPTETLATAIEELRTGANEVFVSADYAQLTNDGVTVCKNHGFQLETWTINTAELIAALPSYVSGGTSDAINFETVVKDQTMA